jgi:hypothetical protein
VFTDTSYKAHLAMAVKLLEIPPSVEGVVGECGCFLGGSTANLSLACEITGRDLFVYDSFEGMPPGMPNDKYAVLNGTGNLKGDTDVVKDTVRRFGAFDRCTFVKGWFKDTLPHSLFYSSATGGVTSTSSRRDSWARAAGWGSASTTSGPTASAG